MAETIAILVLAIVCVAQSVEKYLYTKKMLKQIDDALKAGLARNVHEYMEVTTEPKKADKPGEPDEVLLSEATDDEFMKFIKGQ